MDETTRTQVDAWLNGKYDDTTKAIIEDLKKTNPTELSDAFYKTLDFGTGGLRGLMGVGTNRLNIYTVRMATQGLADYILQQPTPYGGIHHVIIGYDCRHNSQLFAEEAAKVLAGNGIHAYLFSALRPCPLVSFGCRYKKCTAGIMITASHNPPQYNGFKVYWADGAQVLPPHDKGIIDAFNAIQCQSQIKVVDSVHNTLIELVDEEIDHAYLDAVAPLALYPEKNRSEGHKLAVIYSSLHGTGITLVPKILERWGFSSFLTVKTQDIPDGNFPTVKSPNPEDPAAMELGIEWLLKNNADIFVATDPDADRVGIAVLHKGKAQLLNGNQIACLCLEHICDALVKENRMPENAACVKSVVTTELFKAIATYYGKACYEVLPGFKYIGKLIREWEAAGPNSPHYIFGAEESYGYLLGTEARDKDAVLTVALLSEIALKAKLENKTLIDYLHHIYQRHGVYIEKQLAVNFEESKVGHERMANCMTSLIANPPEEIAGISISESEDGEARVRIDKKTGIQFPIALPKSKMLAFRLSDNTKLIIRPSGTEPKIKIYCSVVAQVGVNLDVTMNELEKHAISILAATKSLLNAD